MALKPYREYACGDTNSAGFMYAASERGRMTVVASDWSGSGKVGDSNNKVEVPATASGTVPWGLLLTDVVDIDQSRYVHRGHKFRMETTTCKPVVVAREGSFMVDTVASGVTPSGGDPLYYTNGGLFTNTAGATAVGPIGHFRGDVQPDGYVLIELDVKAYHG